MNEAIFYSLILILVGVYAGFNGFRLMTSSEFLKEYVRKSHRTYLWKKWLGEEKTIRLTQKFFAPLGFLISALLILLGAFNLYVVLF
jgi:hypothetical protein